MDTTIIIPCVRRSRFLEKTTLPAIAAHTPAAVPVVIAHEPNLNVSECRQKWMDLAETRYVYFMDVDSVMEQDEWLEILLDVMDESQAGAVTMAEHWNGARIKDGKPFKRKNITYETGRTAGAGFLYDKDVQAYWDVYLGETYGYIGREFEDIDFGCCIRAKGRRCYLTNKIAFNHAWHQASDLESDESHLWACVTHLLSVKWKLPGGLARDNFFRLLHPLPTTRFEKNHDLDGIPINDAIRQIYGDVVEYWGGNIESLIPETRCLPLDNFTTPEERGVKDIWSDRYREVKPRSPK